MTSRGVLGGTNKYYFHSKGCCLANMMTSLSDALAVNDASGDCSKGNKLHFPAHPPSLLHCDILAAQSLVPLLFSPSIFLPLSSLLAHVLPGHSLLLLSTLCLIAL